MSANELSRTLEHSNAWWRETAQRLIVERRDRSAIPFLRSVAQGGRSAVACVHALWTLDGLGGLDATDVARALRDPHPAVRENAVRLAEARLAASGDLLLDVLRLADDPDERVRFQAALALGETKEPRAIETLAHIAGRDGTDSWMRAAILSSVGERSNEFLREFTALRPSSDTVRAAVMRDLGQLFGAGQSPERCLDLIVQITDAGSGLGWQPDALSGIAQGLRARGLGRENRSAFMSLLFSESPKAKLALQRVEAMLARSSAEALDENAQRDRRLASIGLLGQTDYATAGKTLETLLAPHHPSETQLAAVRALSQLFDLAGATALVDRGRWAAFTPEVREAVLSALMGDERLTPALLDALENGSIAGTAVNPSRRNRLTNHRNAAIQKRARALFAPMDSGDRMQLYERARGTVLARSGNSSSGSRIFATQCATCHAFDGAGGRLGPDLSGIRNQPAEAILLHILIPDYEITPGYHAYVVETRDGRTLVGRLESESPNSLTLRDASSQSQVILRNEVRSMSASPNSLMPNELERAMSEQELADLIAYLKSGSAAR